MENQSFSSTTLDFSPKSSKSSYVPSWWGLPFKFRDSAHIYFLFSFQREWLWSQSPPSASRTKKFHSHFTLQTHRAQPD